MNTVLVQLRFTVVWAVVPVPAYKERRDSDTGTVISLMNCILDIHTGIRGFRLQILIHSGICIRVFQMENLR
jgi:hypothetical protein